MINLASRKTVEITQNVEQTEGKKESKEFTKEQLIVSERYKNRRDVLQALLDSKKKYTFETVDKMIDKFMKGQVVK